MGRTKYNFFFTTIAHSHVPSRVYFARSLLTCSGDEFASCTFWRAFAQPLRPFLHLLYMPTDRDRPFPPIFRRCEVVGRSWCSVGFGRVTEEEGGHATSFLQSVLIPPPPLPQPLPQHIDW